MRLYEFDDQPLVSYWDLVEQLGLSAVAKTFHDAVLPWVNNNKPACITKLSKNAKCRELSKLKLFYCMKNQGFGKKIATLAEYTAFKASPITLWRGGSGQYDPSFQGNGWFSYTFAEARVKAFSDYNGTFATRSYSLNKHEGAAWEVKLTIPVNDILLYLSPSMDSEIIVSAADSANATVVKQT